jgi:hypothetical protein
MGPCVRAQLRTRQGRQKKYLALLLLGRLLLLLLLWVEQPFKLVDAL